MYKGQVEIPSPLWLTKPQKIHLCTQGLRTRRTSFSRLAAYKHNSCCRVHIISTCLPLSVSVGVSMRLLMRVDISLQFHARAIKVQPRINNPAAERSGAQRMCERAAAILCVSPHCSNFTTLALSVRHPFRQRQEVLGRSLPPPPPLHSSSASGLIPRARHH